MRAVCAREKLIFRSSPVPALPFAPLLYYCESADSDALRSPGLAGMTDSGLYSREEPSESSILWGNVLSRVFTPQCTNPLGGTLFNVAENDVTLLPVNRNSGFVSSLTNGADICSLILIAKVHS